MEQDADFNSSVHDQSPMASSTGNNVSPMTQHDPSSLHGTKRRFSQLSEANCGPNSKRLNQTGESYPTHSEDLLRQLDQKQKECEKKDDQLSVYFDFINMLKSNCAEKDVLIDQLKSEATSRDRPSSTFDEQLQSDSSAFNEFQKGCGNTNTQLVQMESTIKQLKAEIAKKDTQLGSVQCNAEKQLSEKEHLIDKLQAESVEMKKQLEKNASTINNLQACCNDKDAQLKESASTINNFQARCDDKDIQLAEKECLVKQLQKRCVEYETEVKVIPESLKNLEDKVNSHFDTLFDRAKECLKQKEYVKAYVQHKEAIKFEQSTQNRSDKLANVFVWLSVCYGEMKRYQQGIDAACSALQYDSNNKDALYNRALCYFDLKKYSDAHQDLKKILQLDRNDADAQELLEKVQTQSINQAIKDLNSRLTDSRYL